MQTGSTMWSDFDDYVNLANNLTLKHGQPYCLIVANYGPGNWNCMIEPLAKIASAVGFGSGYSGQGGTFAGTAVSPLAGAIEPTQTVAGSTTGTATRSRRGRPAGTRGRRSTTTARSSQNFSYIALPLANPSDLTTDQTQIYSLIQQHPGWTDELIAGAINKTRAVVARQLGRMVNNGVLQKHPLAAQTVQPQVRAA
jgi:hypothetical protein